ncbi:MAG TPA: hypothetical protein VIH99_01690 [Bdellovibrionota bacterium]
MRKLYAWIGLFSLLALTGCGNANDGKDFKPYSAKPAAGAAQPVTTATADLVKLLYCANVQLTTSNQYFNQYFSGSTLCATEGNIPNTKGNVVRLKVGAYFPVGASLCAIPFAGPTPFPETCFSAASGQTDIGLHTSSYTNVVFLQSSDLQAYWDYVKKGASYAPPRVIFNF